MQFSKIIIVYILLNLICHTLVLAQHLSVGTGYQINKIKSNTEYDYLNFKKELPLIASFNFKDVRLPEKKASLGIKLSINQIKSEYSYKYSDENRFRSRLNTRLSSFMLNLRGRVGHYKNKYYLITNHAVGLSAHTFLVGGPYWDGCSTSIRYVYNPSVEFLFSVLDNLYGFISLNYYLLFGNMEILYPNSSYLSMELGIVL